MNKSAGAEPKKVEKLSSSGSPAVNSTDIDRLENMMKMMGQKNGEDPEVQQLNTMLERILDIQHPDRVQEKVRQTSELRKGEVFPVSTKSGFDPVSLFTDSPSLLNYRQENPISPFFGLNDPFITDNHIDMITGVFDENQILVSGARVKLRLTSDVYVNGILIPKNNALYGTAMLNGERLNIEIKSIQSPTAIFPVQLTVFDLDGLQGLYIPERLAGM